MTKKKDQGAKPEEKPKAELRPDARLYIYSCRLCEAVTLSNLTYLEHELRFLGQRKSFDPKEFDCPVCGAPMEEVDYPPINIRIRSPKRTVSALEMIRFAFGKISEEPEGGNRCP